METQVRLNRARALRMFVAGVALVLLAFQGAAAGKRLRIRKGSLDIRVDPRPKSKVVKNYWPFAVGVRNRNKGDRTLHAEIRLYSATTNGERQRIGSCTVYVEVKGKRAGREIVQCPASGAYAAWSFHVHKIWPFILKR